MSKETVILGIDPGTNIMGFGVVKKNGNSLTSIDYGVVNMTKKPNHEMKLKAIFESVTEMLEKYHPDHLSIEAPFFGKNVQSMLKLGRAQGVAMAAALAREVPITEYSPRRIKQSITGRGGASKEQVAGMLVSILGLKEVPKQLDASDGLAAAVCHCLQNSKGGDQKQYGSWSSFISKNPDKLK